MSERLARAVCVYCASSGRCDAEYHAAARRLGELLAADARTVVYGGSRIGSMGALADGALARGGRVVGVLPRFLKDLEVSHGGLTELHVVEDMRTRKHLMLSRSEAVVALPGGCGTFEELLEAITLKRLGVFLGPIVIVNTRGYFAPLLELLQSAVRERFMDERHLAMWQVVAGPDEVIGALAAAPPWSAAARSFATL
ncbi:MAG TPA: TIGR00730 family Rossman fold protein [Steroidobacteraceae bacterium]|nr:TIGR00730 family Rossman fold protein [Steroidobacteraceae bacterium]